DQFLFYLKEKSIGKTARRLNGQGYRMKRWVNKAGLEKGGGRYNKSNLAQVLRNPFYIGKLRHKDKLFPGEHKAIVDEVLFNRVQKLLTQNNGTHHSANQDKHDFLLRGLVHCKVCESFMTPNFAYSKGRKYFYYKCTKLNKFDKDACSVKSAPAKELETIIVQRLAFLGRNKKVVGDIVKDAQESSVKAFGPLREDRRRIQDEIRKTDEEAKKLVGALGAKNNGSRNRFITDRLDELQETKQKAEEKLAEIELSIRGLEGRMIDAEVIQHNLQRFEAVFEKLTPNEKKDLLRLLIKEIIYNQDPSKIKMTLRPLPELDLEVEGDKVSFDERQKWLPGQGSN
ncbi:MAG TPA: recombinase family protein, partial [bacterium]|nr:recombinase family protein [bacterium]